jgi:hypothetical protein
MISAGCASTAPEYSTIIGYSPDGAYAAKNFIGEYKGIGIIKNPNGDMSSTFKAVMEGYKDGDVVFMRETYTYLDGGEKQFTYRITLPGMGENRYGCVRIENLDKCTIREAGNTIMIDITSVDANGANLEYLNKKNLFHFLDGTKLLKHTYNNKFVFSEESTELIHYTKVK